MQQMNGELLRLDIIVRYLAIRDYYGHQSVYSEKFAGKYLDKQVIRFIRKKLDKKI